MSTIAILPEQGEGQPTIFSAVFAGRKATGRTVGEALDALTSQLSPEEAGAPVILQQFRPDQFFTAEQRDRLSELMARWRAAREAGTEFSPAEQAELERLVDEEVLGSAKRAATISHDIEATPSRRKSYETPTESLGQSAEAQRRDLRARRVAALAMCAHFILLSLAVILLAVVGVNFRLFYIALGLQVVVNAISFYLLGFSLFIRRRRDMPMRRERPESSAAGSELRKQPESR